MPYSMYYSLLVASQSQMRVLFPTDKRYDDFAIGMCLEVVRLLQLLPYHSVIVYLPIDRKSEGAFIVDQGLSATIYTNISICDILAGNG